MASKWSNGFSFGIRWLVALLLPSLLVLILGSDGSFAIFLPWSLWTVFLGGVVKKISPQRPAVLRNLFWSVIFLLAAWGTVVFFALASYSPVDAYTLWLNGVRDGLAPKAVTYQVTLLVGYATTMIALLSWFIGMRTPLLLLGIITVIGLTILTFWWPLLVLALGVLLVLVYDVSRGGNPAVGGKTTFREALLIPGLALALATPAFFSRWTGASESPEPFEPLRIFADWYLHPGLWALVENEKGFGGSIGTEVLPELNATPLFEVTSAPNRPIYLRLQIYDFFTGKNWQRFPRVLETPAINLAKVQVENPDIEAKLIAEFYPIGPHTLETLQIGVVRPEGPQSIPAQIMPEGIRLDYLLITGDTVRLKEGQEKVKDFNPVSDSVYLQGVPILGPVFLSWLEKQDFFQVVEGNLYLERVKEYLKEIPYVLKIPGGEGTIVERFLLQARKGFSQHFASSAVMLARAKGIPARFVKGLFGWTDDSGKLLITAFHAHYWAEVYLPETGWVTFEASPPYQTRADMTAYLEDVEDRLTREQLEVLANVRNAEATSWDLGRMVWSWSLVGLLVLIPVFIVIRDGYHTLMVFLRSQFSVQIPVLQHLVRRGLKYTFPDPRTAGWETWIYKWGGMRKWIPARLEKLLLPVLFARCSLNVTDRKFLKLLGKLIRS